MCSGDQDRRVRRKPIMPNGEGKIAAHAHYDEKKGLVITRVGEEKSCAGETTSSGNDGAPNADKTTTET